MTSLTRRLTTAMLAAATVVGLSADPAFAQRTPGGATVGPAGGTPSTSAPSNSEGTPSGGTGVISTTRVGPATEGVAPAPAARRATPTAAQRRAAARRAQARRAARQQSQSGVPTGDASSAGLNQSNAPSR